MNCFHKFAKKLSCLMLAAVMLVLIPVSALADYKAVVNSSTRVYAAASTKAPSVKVGKGTVVTVKDTKGGVAKIVKNGNVGYVDQDDLTRMKATRTAVSGRVYQSASTGAKSVAIGKNASVNLISVSGSWAKIERGGNIGYVKKTILEPYYEPQAPVQQAKPENKPETDLSGKSGIDKVIAAAKSRQGCPYVYGNSGPNAFDCSGLVRYAYGKIGVSLSGSAYGQGYGKGEKIEYSDLQPGDIVCFNTNENDGDLVDHTGIYLGGGKFIHASSASGKVIISSMSSGYYKRVFSWARRVA